MQAVGMEACFVAAPSAKLLPASKRCHAGPSDLMVRNIVT